MEYISTRSNREPIKGSQAILRGISPDGGLYLPKALPLIDNLEDLLSLNYRQMALYVLKKFFPELGKERLKNAVNKAYDEKFSAGPVKIRRTKQVNFLELYHGPTLAFKDMALALLPHLLKASKDLENIKEDIIILTATSGDTGKAALEGFANVEGVKIIVFYPKEGVSQVQELQMVTQEGKNTLVVGVKGNFDDTQSGVKTIFNDVDFKERLRENNYIFSSANSINIGRLVPQIIYYIYAYCQMVNKGDISLGERINIVVPTGNFGNILAAYYAKRMGLPVNKLICASNDNNVLTEFLNKRRYDIRRDLILSSSPSMDILISSNLERLIFHLNQKDHQLVKDKMDELEIKGHYQIENMELDDFYGDYANEEEVSRAIYEVFKEENYLIDPHTAVAYGVYKKYLRKSQDKTKTLVASTASPFKFGKKVASSIGLDISDKDEFEILDMMSRIWKVELPESIKTLREKEVLHETVALKEKMKESVETFLRVGDQND